MNYTEQNSNHVAITGLKKDQVIELVKNRQIIITHTDADLEISKQILGAKAIDYFLDGTETITIQGIIIVPESACPKGGGDLYPEMKLFIKETLQCRGWNEEPHGVLMAVRKVDKSKPKLICPIYTVITDTIDTHLFLN